MYIGNVNREINPDFNILNGAIIHITKLILLSITGFIAAPIATTASIGHPILGDFKYGDPKLNEQIQKKYKVRSQLLHSWKLVMPEKLAQPLDYLSGKEFIAPLPAAFKKVLKGEGLETAESNS